MHDHLQKTANLVMDVLKHSHGSGADTDHLNLDTWEWPQGVAMYGMMKVVQRTKDQKTLDFVISWYDRHLQKGLPARNINTTAPMLGLALLYETTMDDRYLPLIKNWAAWIMDEMPRTQEGGLQHLTTHSENPEQLWDDTLYMTVLFLLKASQLLQVPAWQEEAVYQILLHIKYLHSPKNALWYHGFHFTGRHHFASAYWARGNSWITSAIPDMLELLPQNGTSRFIRETWQAQCKELIRLQDKTTGLWNTLLDYPDSYLETSASAAIAYGLLKGVRLGWLDSDAALAANKAVDGVLRQVQEDGIVAGVSYGTPMGDSLDFYRTIPQTPTAYGQGLVFLMLTELLE